MRQTPRFLQEMMIEISLLHEIVIIDQLQLFDQILLPDNQFDHLRGNSRSYFLYYTLEQDLVVLLSEQTPQIFDYLLGWNC